MPTRNSKFAREYYFSNPRVIKNKKSPFSQKYKTYNIDRQRHIDNEKEALGGNITYTQAGVLYFVGQESGKFEVQFFVGRSVVNPCLRLAENR